MKKLLTENIRLRKLLCIFLSILTIFITVPISTNVKAAETGMEVVIGSSTGVPGQLVAIPVEFNNVPSSGINNCDFVLNYDPAQLTVESVDPGTLMSNPTEDFDCNIGTGQDLGKIFLWFDDESLGDRQITTPGLFAKINFRINATAQTGNYPITNIYVGDFAYFDINNNPISIPVTFIDGNISITNNVNHPPTVTDYQMEVQKNNSISGIVVGNDEDGDILAYAISRLPDHGTAALSAANPNEWTYTPNTDYVGTDMFKVTVSDGKGGEAVSTVIINVIGTSTNNPPTVVNYQKDVQKNGFVSDVIVGQDIDGDSLTYTIFAQPAHGAVTVTPAGAWTYTPAADYVGTDMFQVKVSDGKGGEAISTVNINVINVVYEPVEVKIGSAVGERNGYINIPIYLNSIPSNGIQAAGFKLQYNPAILSTTESDITAGSTLIINPATDFTVVLDNVNGVITLAFTDDTAGSRTIMKTGLFANIRFKINETAPFDIYAINEIKQIGFSDGAFNEIGDNVSFINGNATILMYGDVNGDGKVTLTDYQLVKRFAVSGTAHTYKFFYLAGNVNTDTKITLTDCQLIKRFILYGTRFPIQN